MNENDKVVTNEPIAEVQPKNETNRVKTANDGKMMFLTILTMIFGLIMTVSLVVALNAKNRPVDNNDVETKTEEVVEVEKEESIEIEDDELGTKKLLNDIENLDFEEVLEKYGDQEFDKNLN